MKPYRFGRTEQYVCAGCGRVKVRLRADRLYCSNRCAKVVYNGRKRGLTKRAGVE